jgi:hypothetical protein
MVFLPVGETSGIRGSVAVLKRRPLVTNPAVFSRLAPGSQGCAQAGMMVLVELKWLLVVPALDLRQPVVVGPYAVFTSPVLSSGIRKLTCTIAAVGKRCRGLEILRAPNECLASSVIIPAADIHDETCVAVRVAVASGTGS